MFDKGLQRVADATGKKVQEEVVKNVQKILTKELGKMVSEFKRMEDYINGLENRIEKLEKKKTKD